ncbi:MAG: ABC transporter permease [Clostridiales bacterium]|uniref:ABC transporter permease n=1 Tax=Intestinibacter sp. TaxID=1965304 RepID=UPI0025D7605B|nr:ABC transporter permease [Intestinibacter sp.]MDU1203308.1 ABC transporter permease [Clostridiales bacterium]MDY5213418.1 ABC transporter permease [Intestinibacter sp.]
MGSFKRAVLYITRKKKKSILMFFILFCIATAVLSGISIKKATSIARQNSSKETANTFEIQNNLATNFTGTMPESLVNKVSKVNGIKNYDASVQGIGLVFKQLQNVEPKNNTVQYTDKQYENLFPVEAHKFTEYDTKFMSKSFRLVEGRHLVEGDKNKVLVHKALAEKNNLKVGDRIIGTKDSLDYNASKDAPSEYDLEIVGIFESQNTDRMGSKLEIPENLILSDMNTLNALYGYSKGNSQYTSAVFNTNKNVDDVISDVNKIQENWSLYNISKSDDTFLALSKSFDSLEKIVNMLLIGSIIVGIIVLSLVLAFWIQGRIHETGILLSIGVGKFKIISQYIIELLLISVLAFGTSYFSSKMISQNIGDAMVSQASKQAVQEVQQGFGGMSLGYDANTSLATQTVDGIDVDVSLKEVLYVYAIGATIIISSVMISSSSIIRLKPKEILSKMS